MAQYQTFAQLVADLKAQRRLRDVVVDSRLARDILQNGQCINRKITAGKIVKYTRELPHWNHTILGSFSVLLEKGEYRFADGQHRLRALVAASEEGTEAQITVDVVLVESLYGQDEGTPRSVRDFLDIAGHDGQLIAPALVALFRETTSYSGTNTEVMEFFKNPEYQHLLVESAKAVRGWLEEAQGKDIKTKIKPAALCILRVVCIRTNSGEGVVAKIDAFLRDLTLNSEANPNVALLLEFIDGQKTKKAKEAQVIQQVVRASIAGVVLNQAQLARLMKKPARKGRGKGRPGAKDGA